MGAKNHGVIMADANKENTLNQLAGAAFGAAGQRCMALSTAVFVGKLKLQFIFVICKFHFIHINWSYCWTLGEAKEWIPDLSKRAQALKVNAGHVPGTDVGPVISPQSKQRILGLIQSG